MGCTPYEAEPTGPAFCKQNSFLCYSFSTRTVRSHRCMIPYNALISLVKSPNQVIVPIEAVEFIWGEEDKER